MRISDWSSDVCASDLCSCRWSACRGCTWACMSPPTSLPAGRPHWRGRRGRTCWCSGGMGGQGGALQRVGDSRSRCCVNVRAVTLACRSRLESGGCRRLQCRQGRIGDVARMLRRVSLSVFAALAVSLPASALELDRIEVKSGIGQQLLAEIPVVPPAPSELRTLHAQLASRQTEEGGVRT